MRSPDRLPEPPPAALLFVVLAALGAGCPSGSEPPTRPPSDRTVTVTVATDTVVHRTDPRFLSFAVDSSQIAGTLFWNEDPATSEEEPEVPVDPYDFTRARLANLTAPLAPAFLRIGGTHADHLLYDFSDDPETTAPEPYQGVLTRAMWDPMADFARDLGLTIKFTVNAAEGPRDGDGVWLTDQAAELLTYIAEREDPVEVLELGNEPNGYPLLHGFSLDTEQYGDDLRAFAALRDQLLPDAKIAAPSVAYWPVSGEFITYLEPALEQGGDALDVVTWHYYPQQSRRCPLQTREAFPEVLQDPAHLDEINTWAAEVEAAAGEHAPGAEIWLGETGNAQCGGARGVSDRWASSFWWLDQLGLLARRGQKVVVRQTLSGSDYGLMDDTTLTPRPDYWASLLWKTAMGTEVLDATSADPTLRAWAHCAAGSGVAVLAINLSDEVTDLALPGLPETGWRTWTLEADTLESETVRLNGTTLQADGNGTPPALDPAEADWLILPARSIGIAVTPAAGVCG